MISAWTKHLSTEEEKTKFRNEVLSARSVLRRLNELLDEEERSLDRSEMDVKSYESPSWAYLQADKNGFRRALKITKIITNLDHKEPK